MFQRGMFALVDIVQSDSLAFILGYGESQAIRAPLCRHFGASTGVAHIAEIFEFDLRWRYGGCAGVARPAETGAQRQAARERPANHKGLFFGKEKRARHDSPS